MKRFLKNNGLSVVLLALFLIFLGGQTIAGWLHGNEKLKSYGRTPQGLSQYLGSGSYGESVFENWESEFLQMGAYVILTAWLFQKGSAESRDPDSVETEREKEERVVQKLGLKGVGGWINQHSLSLAFFALFLLSFAGHAWSGASAYNEEAALRGQPLLSIPEYLGSSRFWFESFQNWQSEFLAVFSIVVLSIWLREKNSPESKPLDARDGESED